VGCGQLFNSELERVRRKWFRQKKSRLVLSLLGFYVQLSVLYKINKDKLDG